MYRTIDTSLWSDPKVRTLSSDGKLLFMYLITNGHTHVSGIYYLPSVLIAHETGLEEYPIDTLWDTLSKLELARRDEEKELVWVINMFRHQGSGIKNILSASHHLKTLHKSFLCQEFTRKYPCVLGVKNGYPIDTLSEGYPRQGPQEQEQEQEQNYSPIVPSGDTLAPKVKRSAKKAPSSFMVTEDMRAWARHSVPGVSLDQETASFSDYEFRSGHSDWEATWRNWMRKAWKSLPADARQTTTQSNAPFKVQL